MVVTIQKGRAALACAVALALLAPVARAQLEEVVVTAERRAESLQDVSVSVTAFNEEGLALGGIEDVSRLELLVPGLNYAFTGNDAKFNVRGANSSNTFGDNSSIVGAFVDGVYKPRASMQTRAFFDIASVEFLRGPQGTLYGRNTFAGALNVYTNAPDLEEFSGDVAVGFQRFNRTRAEGNINVPVNDNFAIRVAGFADVSDGYIENLAGPDIGAQDDRGIRASARYATDRLDVVARYTRVEEDGNEAGLFGYTFLCRNETEQGLTDSLGSVTNCANPVRGSGGEGPASNGPGGDPWVISQDYVRPVDLTDEEFNVSITYDFDAVSFRSISSVYDYTNDLNFDFDFRPTPNSNGGYEETSEGFSQEFQLSSSGDGRFRWTTGGYYSEIEDFSTFYIYQQTVRDDSTRPTVIGPGGMEFTVLEGTDIVSQDTNIGGFFADSRIIDTTYFGIYGQAEFDITDRARIIAGIRYNDEDKDLSCGGSNFTGDINEDGTTDIVVTVAEGVEGSSPTVLPDSAQDVFVYNCDASDAITSAGVDGFGEFDNVTWRAGIEFDVTDNVMTYISASTGYLSGSVTTSGSGVASTDEQESQVIEVGFRSVLFDNTLQFNGAFHYTEYTNLLTQVQRIEGGIAITEPSNGGDIEAYGVELDAIWLPTDNWTLSANMAWLDSEFGTFGQQNPYQLLGGVALDPNFVDQAGRTTPWSPDLTIGASAGYTHLFSNGSALRPYLQFYYSDGYNTSNLLASDPAQDQDSFTKTDFRLIWDSANQNYSIEAFVENIEDEAVLARGNNNSDDIVQTSYLFPRNYGVRFKIRFN